MIRMESRHLDRHAAMIYMILNEKIGELFFGCFMLSAFLLSFLDIIGVNVFKVWITATTWLEHCLHNR